ncbi:MAG: hypothetical protein ACOYVK_19205 [Bacillota bacterium]
MGRNNLILHGSLWTNKGTGNVFDIFIFTTHDIDEALYLADVIHIFQGPPLTWKKDIHIEIPTFERKNHKDEMDRYREIILDDPLKKVSVQRSV